MPEAEGVIVMGAGKFLRNYGRPACRKPCPPNRKLHDGSYFRINGGLG